MQHEHSVFFGIFNALFEKLFGPVGNAPAWWVKGVTLGGLTIRGIAPLGENGEPIGWIPDHVAMALVVLAGSVAFFAWASRSYRKDAPGPVQNVIEVFVDFLRGEIKENIQHGGKYLPIVGAFFFFIALSNLCGVFFFLQPPTSNLNVTFALSITCFLFFNACGIKAHGLVGYLKHFLGSVLALAPLMFVIEMIGNFARALSLSMRLYGNIFGEHTATGIFTSLVPIVVPWPMMALGVFTAFLQAYVFSLLTAVYIGGATAHDH